MSEPARVFVSYRRVLLGDVDRSGRVRLDAIARFLQDVATEDALDAGLADGWVLRRTVLTIHHFPRFRDVVELRTWCSGLAATAAARSTTIVVDRRPVVEAEALWAFLGADGRPARIDRAAFAAYGIGRDAPRVSTRLHHGEPPDGPGRPWPLRAADIDVLGHVNNTVWLAALEDLLAGNGTADTPPPWLVEVEYRAPIEPDEAPQLVSAPGPGGGWVAALVCGGVARATARLAFPAAPGPPS